MENGQRQQNEELHNSEQQTRRNPVDHSNLLTENTQSGTNKTYKLWLDRMISRINARTSQPHWRTHRQFKKWISMTWETSTRQESMAGFEFELEARCLRAKRVVAALASTSMHRARWSGCIWARTSGSVRDRNSGKLELSRCNSVEVRFTESITVSGTMLSPDSTSIAGSWTSSRSLSPLSNSDGEVLFNRETAEVSGPPSHSKRARTVSVSDSHRLSEVRA